MNALDLLKAILDCHIRNGRLSSVEAVVILARAMKRMGLDPFLATMN